MDFPEKSSIRKLLCDEDGGAYTLSYVMVVPILMLLTCITVETSLLMSAKVGTAYSAWSGTRTAVVWSSAVDDWSDVEQKVEQAAIQSFVPFSSGMGNKGDAPDRATDYAKSYSEFTDESVSENYIRAKYANAANRMKVETSGRPSEHDGDVTVTVEYRFRFNVPGIGKLLGDKDADGYYFPLKSTATLQNEGPKNEQQNIGIGYGKLD